MSYFIRNGNTYRVAAEEAVDLKKVLPVGTYTIKQDMFENFFLEIVDDFKPLAKYYGDTVKRTERIMNTFHSREYSTGVMLTGEKGSGKTLLAKSLSIAAAKEGIPTIVINAPWAGEKFNTFMQDIEQPCIILFDEFEKVYDSDTQEMALTLLDGVYPSKKMFILTCNDKWRINQHMRNRPGRIFYMLDYVGLSTDFITEYCDDNLDNKLYTQKICELASLFEQFNFDMLKALVEEMNRYNETPQEALQMLNAKPEYSNSSNFEVRIMWKGIELTNCDKFWNGNPLNGVVRIDMNGETPIALTTDKSVAPRTLGSEEFGLGEYHNFQFTPNHIHRVDAKEGRFIYVDGDATCVLTRKKESSYNYLAM